MWQTFLAIAIKELVHASRDKFTIRRLLVTQALQLLLLGFIDLNARDLPTILVDQDQTFESRDFVQKLEATKTFKVDRRTSSIVEARDRIRAGRASVALIIPPGYGRERARPREAKVLMLVDGSDATSSQQAVASIESVAARANLTADQENVERTATVTPYSTLLFNPRGETSHFMLPGLMAIILGIGYMGFSAGALVRERDQGTLERLLMTPLSYYGLMMGKIAPYFGIGLVNACLLLLVMRWGFGVPIRGSAVLLVISLAFYLLSILSIGTFVAALARSASEIPGLMVMLFPLYVWLSGYVFPLSSIPKPLLPLSYLLPPTHMIAVTRGITLRGAGIADLLPDLLYLVFAPVVLITAAARRFKASLD